MKKLQSILTILIMLGLTSVAHAQLPTKALTGEISGITRNLVNDNAQMEKIFQELEKALGSNAARNTKMYYKAFNSKQ